MYTTNLRKVGGSVMLSLSPAILKMLDLESGSEVELAIEKGRLIVEPHKPHKYTLAELLSEHEIFDDPEWLSINPVGRELI